MKLHEVAHAMRIYGSRIGREFTLLQVRRVRQLIAKREYSRVHPDILKLLNIRESGFEMYRTGVYCNKGAGDAFREWVNDRPDRRKELIANNPELRSLIYSWTCQMSGMTKDSYDLVLPCVLEVERSEVKGVGNE